MDQVKILACDATVSDADLRALIGPCCADAEGLTPPDEQGLARMRGAQETDPAALTLALEAGEPVGICAMHLSGEETTAHLRLIGVRPDRRRRKIGRALEAHAVGLARQHGLCVLRTSSGLDTRNRAGVAFLESLGWEPEEGAGIRMWRSLEAVPPARLPEGYAFRTYREGDAGAFVRIKNAAFAGETGAGRAWTPEDFQKEYLESPYFRPERVFFAACGEELVGTTTAWTAMHEGREVGLIHWVAVTPGHRGRGVGEALNARALCHLKEMGYREAVLSTNASLRAAVRLYHRLGFQEVYRKVNYFKRLKGEE
jgi:mycothiol synthase